MRLFNVIILPITVLSLKYKTMSAQTKKQKKPREHESKSFKS